MQLYVNGERLQNLTSMNSGGWNKVATRNVTVQLKEGVNVVRLCNPSAWMPDLDYMKVELVEPDAVEDITADSPSAARREVYDISGRRIGNPGATGIMVVGGKKVKVAQ